MHLRLIALLSIVLLLVFGCGNRNKTKLDVENSIVYNQKTEVIIEKLGSVSDYEETSVKVFFHNLKGEALKKELIFNNRTNKKVILKPRIITSLDSIFFLEKKRFVINAFSTKVFSLTASSINTEVIKKNKNKNVILNICEENNIENCNTKIKLSLEFKPVKKVHQWKIILKWVVTIIVLIIIIALLRVFYLDFHKTGKISRLRVLYNYQAFVRKLNEVEYSLEEKKNKVKNLDIKVDDLKHENEKLKYELASNLKYNNEIKEQLIKSEEKNNYLNKYNEDLKRNIDFYKIQENHKTIEFKKLVSTIKSMVDLKTSSITGIEDLNTELMSTPEFKNRSKIKKLKESIASGKADVVIKNIIRDEDIPENLRNEFIAFSSAWESNKNNLLVAYSDREDEKKRTLTRELLRLIEKIYPE